MGTNNIVVLSETTRDQEPSACSGNACSKISVTTTLNWPGTLTIRTVTVENSGSKPARVTFEWGNALGGCGLLSGVTVPAGGSADLQLAQAAMVIGYCKMSAKFV
jgi:hypothetical protein